MNKRLTAGLLLALQFVARPAYAWDAIGHEVIARIAWEQMTPRARAAAIALLSNAPDDSDLLDLYPLSGPAAERERTLFVEASTWSDIVRDREHPERAQKYHRGNWHYINYFFEETPQGPRDRPDLRPDSVNATVMLDRLEDSVQAVMGRPSPQRAIDLAWILHLVGDIHQPLHGTARVTETEPRGDQGGNLVRLDGERNNLHGYWDQAISREHPERPGETEADRVARIARTLMERHPRAEFASAMEPGEYDAWAREGFETSKRQVYATPRGQAPSPDYARATYATAERAAALAGYRLAALLNRVLGGEISG